MIDKRKNMFYEIKVHYYSTSKEFKTVKFVTEHSISTKKFDKFMKEYFKTVEDFEWHPEDWGSQYTVSNAIYEEYKDKLHEGMTPDRYLLAKPTVKQKAQSDNAEKLERAYDYIVGRLQAEGCVLMVYKAMTTNSIYLKVDDGVGGSIRISDHKGKKHLGYTYNLVMGSARKVENFMGNPRWYAPLRDIEVLVDTIIRRRNVRKKQYGARYYEFMESNANEGEMKRGFWQQAEYLKGVDRNDIIKNKGRTTWRISNQD